LAGGAAVAAAAGGIAASKLRRSKRRKFVPVGRPKIQAIKMPELDAIAGGISNAGRHLGRTGEQLSRIAEDVQTAGTATERLGRLLSK
jgi:hypothetical protein